MKIEKNKLFYVLLGSLAVNLVFLNTYITRLKDDGIEEDKYHYLSKRVDELDPDNLIINFVPLRKELKDYMADKPNLGFYFEYLPTGVSVGVNDKQEVVLASLSKVPLAMSIMKKVEKGGVSLDDVVTIKHENLDPKFGDLWKDGEGKQFTVKELLEYMLKTSDNTAYNALMDLLTDDEAADVYSNLEVEVFAKNAQPIVSPKVYSSIFRSLYLSSYLKPEDSDYLLKLLTVTDFNDKIPAGVPKDVEVAHKVGIFNTADTADRVFSDCGIVYIPDRSYLLCAFDHGEESDATEHISYISKKIYEYISTTHGGVR